LLTKAGTFSPKGRLFWFLFELVAAIINYPPAAALILRVTFVLYTKRECHTEALEGSHSLLLFSFLAVPRCLHLARDEISAFIKKNH
jgi:hypothetical protein